MSKKELWNLIVELRKDERHHAQVEKFINKLQSTSLLSGWIPYTDLKYDTLYLAANTHSNCYYIFVPSHKQVEGKIGIYWMKINSDTVPSRQRNHLNESSLNFSYYGVSDVYKASIWVRKLEELKDFPTQFLNWNGEPWEEIK